MAKKRGQPNQDQENWFGQSTLSRLEVGIKKITYGAACGGAVAIVLSAANDNLEVAISGGILLGGSLGVIDVINNVAANRRSNGEFQ